MPLVEITMVEGRTPQQLRALLSEIPATHWQAGGTTIAERRGGTQ
jgi:4-oxalocrotonate tautomerase